jgi:hypothetical protein
MWRIQPDLIEEFLVHIFGVFGAIISQSLHKTVPGVAGSRPPSRGKRLSGEWQFSGLNATLSK